MAFYSHEMKYIFEYGIIKRRETALWIMFIEHTFYSTHQSLGYDTKNVRRIMDVESLLMQRASIRSLLILKYVDTICIVVHI